MAAAAGERGVGVGEFQQTHWGVADGETEAGGSGVGAEGGEAEGGEKLIERGGPAEGVELAHGRNIERAGERAAQGDGPAVGMVIVFREIQALRGAERAGDIGENGGGRSVVRLHRQQIGERFERGPRRAGKQRAVELAAPRIAPRGRGNEREDFPARIVDHHHRGMAEVGVLELRGFLVNDGFEFALEGEVESGADFLARDLIDRLAAG